MHREIGQTYCLPAQLRALKMQDVKMQDMKMTDQVAGHEIAEQASF